MKDGVALVTGAAGIVGPAICQALRKNGWQVCAADRTAEAFASSANLYGAEPFWDHQGIANLLTRQACEKLVRETEHALGPISLLVNNAALPYRAPSLRELDEDQSLAVFKINTLAPLWLTAAAEPSLVSAAGTVINISSAQTRGAIADNHIYVASKATLESLTQTLAGTLGPRGVRCMGVRLGSFPGDHFMRDLLEQLPGEAADNMLREIMPLHLGQARKNLGTECVGDLSEIADLVVFLSSPQARMLHGGILDFDGGFTSRPRPWTGPVQSRQMAEEWIAKWKNQSPSQSAKTNVDNEN